MPANNYSSMTLVCLMKAVTARRDRSALNELLSRPIPFGGIARTVPDYLMELHGRRKTRIWCRGDCVIADEAYNLTLDKFNHLPSLGNNSGNPNMTKQRGKGPDCRRQYRLIVKTVKGKLASGRCSVRDADLLAAGLLEKMLRRHFKLSCYEAVRQAKGPRRSYRWKAGGQ